MFVRVRVRGLCVSMFECVRRTVTVHLMITDGRAVHNCFCPRFDKSNNYKIYALSCLTNN